MHNPDDNLFDLDKFSTVIGANGQVSARCQLRNDETHGLVVVDGSVVYTYRRDDREAFKQTWLAVFERGLLTGEEFEAAGLGSRRSLQYWVARKREGGVIAVMSLPRSGGPVPTIDEEMRRKIVRLRKALFSGPEIARECSITSTSVYTVLREEKERIAAAAQELDFAMPPPLATAAEEALPEQCESGVVDEIPVTIPSEPAVGQIPPVVLPTPVAVPIPCLNDTIEAALAEDRSADRLAARIGLLDDAAPLFAPAEQVECAGAFLALAVLADDPCLTVASTIFGRLGSSFFGLRATMVTIFLLLILRYRRPETMRSKDVHALGRLLGLDRLPEVKTLRRKIHQLAALDPTGEFMKEMAKARAEEAPQKPSVVLIDGHVQAYWGTRKVAQTWAPRCGRVVKGVTGNWVHLPGGQPLLSVDSPFNEGLSKMLPQIIQEACRALGQPSITAVFDRGGYKALLFEEMTQAGHKFLTYRKGGDAVDESCFEQRPTIIGNREYAFAPYERQIELTVHIVTASKTPGGRAGSKDTGRVITLREIRILRPDKGQTAILTNIGPEEPAEQLAAILFDRIGSQENSFKYMRSDFGLDERWTYQQEVVAGTADHPNPNYQALAKALRQLQADRAKTLTKLGAAVKKVGIKALGKKSAKIDATLNAIEEKIATVQAQMLATPTREKPAEAGYVQPELAGRSLINTMRMVAWDVETRLVGMLAGEYSRCEEEGRKLIVAALSTRGSMRLTPGYLVIQLAPQASPNRTRAINAVGQRLNAMAIKYPGSGRILRFEATPVAEKRG